jgi:hypothetical protein
VIFMDIPLAILWLAEAPCSTLGRRHHDVTITV